MSKDKKAKNADFLVHGGILALAGLIVRFIGMIYRIPMVNIIGREGNGYYSNAYSVYNILLLFSSYSLPLAISKMVSARISLNRWKEAKRIVIVAHVFASVIGTAFGLMTFLLADFFCTTVLNSPLAAIALKFMAPTVAIMAFLGVFRGFFQGLQNMIPTAVSQIFEQIINAVFSVLMAAILFSYGAGIAAETGVEAYRYAWGAAGGTIGTGAGALAALALMLALFIRYWKTLTKKADADETKKIRSYGKLLSILTLTAVPIILSTATYNAIDIIDSALFNHAEAARGLLTEEYIAVWGDYNSAYLLLIHLPVALASALGSALVPSLSAAYAANDKKQVLEKVNLAVRVTLLIAIPCAFGMMAVGGNLAKLLFTGLGPEAPTYLVIGGLAVIFYSLATVTNAILQGLNHMQRPMLHAFFSLIAHILILLLLLYVFKAGIYGVIICYMLFGLGITVLNLISIRKLTGYMIEPHVTLIRPVIVSVAMVLLCLIIAFVFSRFVPAGRLQDFLIVFLSLLFGAALYLAGILLTGCLTRSLLRAVPGGRKTMKLFEKMHLLRKS